MRVLAIRGQNIASLADAFEVDLDAEPIASSRLFAIVGPTGSGKSTLLDTLCLALFHRTPRLGGRGGSNKIGGLKEEHRIGNRDVRGLLHRGATHGFAECDFEGQNGLLYRARWSVRRAGGRADGRLQQATYSLTSLDDGSAIGRTKTEVATEIVERLGLTFEQFRRSVLLAQGDFAAFLKAGNDERAALLERMTATPIYAQLSVAAHETARDKRNALSSRSARRDAHVPMSQEERRSLEQARISATKEEHVAVARVELAGHLVRVLERDRELIQGISEAAAAQHHAQQRMTAAGPRKEALALAGRSEAFREAVAAHDAQAEELCQERKRASETRARARKLKETARLKTLTLSAIREQLGVMQANSIEFEQKVEQASALDIAISHNTASQKRQAKTTTETQAAVALAQRGLAAFEDELQRGRDRLRSGRAWIEQRPYRRSVQDIQRLRRAIDELTKKDTALRTLAARRTSAREAGESTRRAVTEATAALKAARTLRDDLDDSIDSDRPPENLQRLHDEKQTLEANGAAIQRWKEAALALAAARSRHAQAVQASERASEEYERVRAVTELAEAQVRENEKALEVLREKQRQENRDRAAAMLRAQLEEGDSCPVCGSETHALPEPKEMTDVGVEQALSLLEQRTETDQELCRQKRIGAASKQAQAAAADAHTRAVSEQLAQLESETLTLEKDVRSRLASAEIPAGYETPESLHSWVKQRTELLSARIMDVFTTNERLTRLRLAQKGANAAVEQASARLQAALTSNAQEQAALQVLEQEHEGSTLERTRLLRLVAEHGGAEAEDSSFAKSVEDDADVLQTRLAEIAALTQETVALEVRVAERTKELSRHMLAKQTAEATLATLVSEGLALQSERAKVLSSSIADARKERAAQDTQLRAQVEAAERECRDAERASSNTAAVAATLESSVLSKQDKHTDAHTTLRERLAAAHLSFGVVRATLASDQSLASEEAALEQLKQAAAITLAELRQRQNDRTKWREANTILLLGLEAGLELEDLRLAVSVSALPQGQEPADVGAPSDLLPAEAETDSDSEAEAEAEPSPALRLPIQPGLFDQIIEQEKKSEPDVCPVVVDGVTAIRYSIHESPLKVSYVRATAGERPNEPSWQAQAQRWQEEAQQALDDAREWGADIRARERQDDQQRVEWATLNTALKDEEAELAVWEELSALIGSGDGKVFRGFAQSVTLDILLGQANAQLTKLYPRYGLERAPGTDLGLQVVDHDMGGVVRSVDTLSGGESFVVSLALALALASLSAQRTPLRTLFIDEGFGALDQDSLETVLDVLDTVQASGKQIGIISHIPEIAERFRVRVVVKSRHDGQSTVQTEPRSEPKELRVGSTSAQAEFDLR